MLYGILKPIAVVLMRLLFRLEASGADNIPAAGPVLIVANHSSVLDPPLVGGACPRPLTFLAKAELFRIPGLGGLIRRLGAQPLRREGADPGALRTAQRVLAEGRALLVFPEGTRGPEGTLRDAKPGAALLAMHGGVPVVPAYVSGSGRAWPRGRRLPRPAKVRVTFGAPMRFAPAGGADRKQQYEAASRRMMAAIADLKDRSAGGAGIASARRPLQIH
ncbi:MAG TPA: lysophospholipid acyltransferase family protein [Methylomirabilota bacterium]|nr:lysophospholipid acyltransferase family protein [Methylomirabilota bacterium]